MTEVEELALKTKGCVVSYATSSYGSYDEFSKVIDGFRGNCVVVKQLNFLLEKYFKEETIVDILYELKNNIQRGTYWCTTGSYPQAFILSFPKLVYISSVKIRSYFVQLVTVEKSVAETTQQFEEICDKELEVTDHCHQVETLHSSKFSARHLRFTIQSGYDHICAVYRVEVQGSFNKLSDGYRTESSPSPITAKDKPHNFNSHESPRSIQKESPMWVEEDDEKDETATSVEAINHSTRLMSLHSSEDED